jgi:hypothetical protein
MPLVSRDANRQSEIYHKLAVKKAAQMDDEIVDQVKKLVAQHVG